MREKKSWRKDTFHQNEDVKLALVAKHDEQARVDTAAKMSNSELFSINANKEGLQKRRDKLRADRFRQQEQKVRSPTEEVLIKRIMEKKPV